MTETPWSTVQELGTGITYHDLTLPHTPGYRLTVRISETSFPRYGRKFHLEFPLLEEEWIDLDCTTLPQAKRKALLVLTDCFNKLSIAINLELTGKVNHEHP